MLLCEQRKRNRLKRTGQFRLLADLRLIIKATEAPGVMRTSAKSYLRSQVNTDLPLRHTRSRLRRRPAKLKRIRTHSLRSEESRHVFRKIAQGFDGKASYYRIREEKQRAVPHSIRICQLQPTAVCRSAPEFASPILRPANQ